MFQQTPHDQQSKNCYPLLVPGNAKKNSLQHQQLGGSNGSSSSSTTTNIGASTAKSIGMHTNEKISNQSFGMDHVSNNGSSSNIIGGVSSTIPRGNSGMNTAQSSYTSTTPFNQETLPRPIATFEKTAPINLREFTNVGGYPLGPSNMNPSSLRNASSTASTNLLSNLSTTIPSAPSTMGNAIISIPPQQEQQQNRQPEHNSEHGPKLHFCKKQLKEQTCAELHSEPEFRVNDKTKHPPNTLFNVSIKDVLTITGYFLNDCEMFLRLDNGSQHGSPVGSCFFKPTTMVGDSSNRLFRAKIDIPPSLNTKKGNTSSRVGFVEIYDSNNKMIAVSDKFWIRSRSRNQMIKDESTKKRIRMNQKGESQKQQKVFHDYSPTSPQSETNSNPENQEEELIENVPSSKKVLASVPQLQHPGQYANPLSGAPSTGLVQAGLGGIGFNYDQRKQSIAPPMTSFSTATTSLLQQQQQVANDFSLGNMTDFWNTARNTTPDFPQNSSFSFLDREMSNASNSRAPTTSNLLTPSSWASSNSQQGEPLKTLENLVKNQQQRIEELSCLIANNAKLIHTLQMHVLSLTNPINSEP